MQQVESMAEELIGIREELNAARRSALEPLESRLSEPAELPQGLGTRV